MRSVGLAVRFSIVSGLFLLAVAGQCRAQATPSQPTSDVLAANDLRVTAGPPNVVADPHAGSDAEVIQNQGSVATAQSGELKSVMENFIYERTAN